MTTHKGVKVAHLGKGGAEQHLTVDKREFKDFPQLPSADFFLSYFRDISSYSNLFHVCFSKYSEPGWHSLKNFFIQVFCQNFGYILRHI